MEQYHYKDVDGMQALVSEEFGDWSEEVDVSQELINQFADMTGDRYWIHTDPEKAKTDSPFGCTVAHGFLTLVLLPRMQVALPFEITGFTNVLNYGSDKLRFTNIVPAGSKIHARSRVKSIKAVKKGTQFTMEQHIHVVGQDDRPAVVYELILIYI